MESAMEQLESRPEGFYYLADLDEGIAEATRNRHVWEGPTEHEGITYYRVMLGDGPQPDNATLAEFGDGPDRETAWRYALGAFYG